jgi:hyperosmotically inducible protein
MRLKILSVISTLLLFGLLVGCSQQQRASAPNTDNIEQSFSQAGLDNVDVKANHNRRVIQLTGNVNTQADKDQAEQIAKNAAPGYTVANEILVKPEGAMGERAEDVANNMDDAIKSNLQAEMAKRPLAKDQDVNFDVKNGVVTLTGNVNSQRQRSQVTEMAKSVPGVKQVVNEMKVQGHATTASE